MAKEQSFTPFSEDTPDEAVAQISLSVVVPQAPIAYDYVPTSEDLVMPRIFLLQGNAEQVLNGGARPGDWLLPGGQTEREFTVTVLGMRRSRIRSIKGANDDKLTVLCQSPDAVQGYGDPGILCRACSYASWGEKDPKTGKGTPPSCRLRYHYLVETENADQAELTINTTTKPAKQAAQAITECIARWGSNGTFEITMSQRLEETNGNRYFVPVVKSIKQLTRTAPTTIEIVQ